MKIFLKLSITIDFSSQSISMKTKNRIHRSMVCQILKFIQVLINSILNCIKYIKRNSKCIHS